MTAPAALTIIESPYAGSVALNLAYARHCVRDSILRGETPFASHLLYTQFSILNDTIPEERALGMELGFRFYPYAALCAVYTDNGISAGMAAGIDRAKALGVPIAFRSLYNPTTNPAEEKTGPVIKEP